METFLLSDGMMIPPKPTPFVKSESTLAVNGVYLLGLRLLKLETA